MFVKNSPKTPRTKGIAKVPLFMQMEALECGAAALAMVMAYYGKWLTLEKVRVDCGVSRDGSNAKNMLRAARSYGMNAKGYRYTAELLKEKAKFPCILHWDSDHFVVLQGFRRKKALLADPENGLCTVDMDEFERRYSGVCLAFEPSATFIPSGKKPSVLNFAKKRLKGTRAAFVFVGVSALISSLMEAAQPGFARVFVDRLLTGENPDWLYSFIIGLIIFSAVQVILTVLNTLYLLKIQGKLAVVASSQYMWHVLRLPMTFFSQRSAGDINLRRGYNEGIAVSLMGDLMPVGLSLVMITLYLTIMLRYSVTLTLIGLIAIAVDLLVATIISKIRVNTARVQMRDSGTLAGFTASGIEMIETIKASGAEDGYFEKWSGYLAQINARQTKFVKIDAYLGAVPGVVSTLTGIAILMTGVFMTINGQFTIGMILAFHGLMASFEEPAGALIDASQALQETRTNMELVEDVLGYPADVPEDCGRLSDNQDYQKLSGQIEIRDMTFGYAPLGAPLIEGLSLTIAAGSSVAFVGASGCGKSTLSKLIMGFYKPWSGEILFDGKPRAQINRTVFVNSVAMVDQDIILFEDSVANNIKLWDESIENYEMTLAGADARLHEEILQRDGGYSHQILDGGKDFSGGQRQRMEIARVLARDTTIVILDEATSALDATTEHEVMTSIRKRGITSIIIAHRLSTIRDCDLIVVLDDGKVLDRGTHDELLAKGGLYTKLVCAQM